MNLFALLYNKFYYRPYIQHKLKCVGINFRLGPQSEIKHCENISIGDNFFSGKQTYMSCNSNNPIVIGNNVMLGPFVTIIGGSHDYEFSDNHMRLNPVMSSKKSQIIIDDGAWIGCRTTILSGAIISEGSVIGAMSLITKYIPPYTIATGIASCKIRRRFADPESLRKIIFNTKSRLNFEHINSIYKEYNINY